MDKPVARFVLALVVLGLGFILTPTSLIVTGKPKKDRIKWFNVLVTTIAFVLWAYLLGGPFAMDPLNKYPWAYDKRVAAFIVGGFTWILAVIPYEKFA